MTIFCIFEYSIFIQFHIRISNIFEYGKFPTKWAILKQNPLRIGQVTAKYASPIAICLYYLNFAFENWCKNRKHKDKTANAPPYERWGYGNIFVQIFDLIFKYSNIAQVQKIFEFRILFIFTGGSSIDLKNETRGEVMCKWLAEFIHNSATIEEYPGKPRLNHDS